jgi:hypothetical protein
MQNFTIGDTTGSRNCTIEEEVTSAGAFGQNLMKAISFFGHKMGVTLFTGRVIDTSGIALAHSSQKERACSFGLLWNRRIGLEDRERVILRSDFVILLSALQSM